MEQTQAATGTMLNVLLVLKAKISSPEFDDMVTIQKRIKIPAPLLVANSVYVKKFKQHVTVKNCAFRLSVKIDRVEYITHNTEDDEHPPCIWAYCSPNDEDEQQITAHTLVHFQIMENEW